MTAGESTEMEPTSNPRREQIAILRRDGLTYAQIGKLIGISRQRVKQILKAKTKRDEMDIIHSKKVLRVGEVARLLGLHVNTVRRWSDEGVLKSFRVGLRWERRFQREDVDAFVRSEEASSIPGGTGS